MQVPYSQQPLNSDELELIRACQLPPDPEAQRLLPAQIAHARGDQRKTPRLFDSPDDEVRSPMPGMFPVTMIGLAMWLMIFALLGLLICLALNFPLAWAQ